MLVAQESPNQPDVIALIADLDAYQDTLYPAEARYALDLASLTQLNVRFIVARTLGGTAAGCGAVVFSKDYGELKRMFVSPEHRGKGVATAILLAI
jgi:putative acetyltransferase